MARKPRKQADRKRKVFSAEEVRKGGHPRELGVLSMTGQTPVLWRVIAAMGNGAGRGGTARAQMLLGCDCIWTSDSPTENRHKGKV